MGRVTLRLPRLGETMEEARVTAWLVAAGRPYRRGDVLMEVETDKTVVEVPAMADGTMVAHLVAEGETVALDQPFAEVEQQGVDQARPDLPHSAASASASAPVASPVVSPAAMPAEHPGLRASPSARAAARRSGVDLAGVAGTGRNGRVTAADVAARPAVAEEPARIVLLHGLFDSAKGWRDLPQRLARQGFAVHAPDLPGHGDHEGRGGGAEDLESLVDSLLPDLPSGPIALVGHSLGAALAVRLAGRLGPRVALVVLIAPAGIGARINVDFLDGMLAAETPAALGRALSLLDGGALGEAFLAEELARLTPRRASLAALARSLSHLGMQQIDLRAELDHLACPVKVVWGTADRILDWHAVADLPAQVAIHLVRGAGHLPHLTAPGLVPDLLAAGLAAVERGMAS